MTEQKIPLKPVEFARVDYATLQTVPVAQDADLLALGSQITSGGTL